CGRGRGPASRCRLVPVGGPGATAAEIRELAGAARAGAPAFVPSRSGHGTNGVALAPPGAMPLKFGEPSFENHLVGARAGGLEPRILRLRGLGLDVDAPEDLAVLVAEAPATESARLVRGWASP